MVLDDELVAITDRAIKPTLAFAKVAGSMNLFPLGKIAAPGEPGPHDLCHRPPSFITARKRAFSNHDLASAKTGKHCRR
jgi:hypothetical protein